MKKLNAKGPEVLGNLPKVRGLPPKYFKEAIEDEDNVLIDTRMMLAFGGGHIKGALSIGGLPMLSIWAGWLLDADKPILLVLESDEKLNEVVRLFLRTGYTKFAGYLVGGMKAWDNAGLPLDEVGQMTVHEIKARGKKLQLLDVRAPDEWKGGHIPNARHIFLGELREKLGELDKEQAHGGVLRQRLSCEHRDQHLETGRIWLRLQRARKLAGVEESGLSRGRRD
jgi:hydroxyacylglutathione hydrolase